MNFYPDRPSASLPNSQIKSPGVLFKDKKNPFEMRRVQEKQVQTLLKRFKDQIASPFHSASEIPLVPTERSAFLSSSRSGGEEAVKICPSTPAVSPGKLKETCDKISNLTQRTKDILMVYGLELIVDDSKVTREIYNLLKIFVPEVCSFPSDFFKRLRIGHVIITKDDIEDDFLIGIISLSVSKLDTRAKLKENLYETIFEHVMIETPEIVERWRQYVRETSCDIPDESGEDLKETFMALMNNVNHALIRPETKKLRELLAVYYPEAMSEERFKNRNREKKKSYKVRFNTQSTDIWSSDSKIVSSHSSSPLQ